MAERHTSRLILPGFFEGTVFHAYLHLIGDFETIARLSSENDSNQVINLMMRSAWSSTTLRLAMTSLPF